MQATEAPNIEEEREQRMAELTVSQGPEWAEQYKPGSSGCHELLDRTSIAADLVEQYVLAHPSCVQNPDWFALAEQAVTALRELYQRVGAEHLDGEIPAVAAPSTPSSPPRPVLAPD